MSWASKRKPIYDVDDICDRFGLNLTDIDTLIVEYDVRFCTPVAGLLVEMPLAGEAGPAERRELTGLVDLRPQDAIALLRQGSMVLEWLATERHGAIRVLARQGEPPGLSVHRTQIGIRPEDLQRLQELIGEAKEVEVPPTTKQRGPQPRHDWKAFYIETARLFYFDGVPPSKNAVVRHLQHWCRQTGRPAPDDSTLKRELRDYWERFAPEAQSPKA